MWSWDPCVVTAEQLSVIALPRAPSLGRARFGGIRAVAGLYNNGTIRMVDANDGMSIVNIAVLCLIATATANDVFVIINHRIDAVADKRWWWRCCQYGYRSRER